MTIGGICFHHDSGISWAQYEGAGWSIRFGGHLWAMFHTSYRDRNPWPKWARFALCLRKPRDV